MKGTAFAEQSDIMFFKFRGKKACRKAKPAMEFKNGPFSLVL